MNKKTQGKKSFESMIEIKGKVPKNYYEKMVFLANNGPTRLSLSMLILRAIGNELECEVPFKDPLESPSLAFEPEIHSNAVIKLKAFIGKEPGLSAEHLFYLRDEIGIPDKTEFLIALSFIMTWSTSEVVVKTSATGYKGLYMLNEPKRGIV